MLAHPALAVLHVTLRSTDTFNSFFSPPKPPAGGSATSYFCPWHCSSWVHLTWAKADRWPSRVKPFTPSIAFEPGLLFLIALAKKLVLGFNLYSIWVCSFCSQKSHIVPNEVWIYSFTSTQLMFKDALGHWRPQTSKPMKISVLEKIMKSKRTPQPDTWLL